MKSWMNQTVNVVANHRPKFGVLTVAAAVILANVACGSFHAVDESSGSNKQTILATPTPTTGGVGGEDGWYHGPTPTPTPVVIATPTPMPTATPIGATPTPTPTPVQTVAANFRVMTYNVKEIPCLRDNVLGDIITFFGVKQCPAVSDGWTKRNKERAADLLNYIQLLRNAGREPDVIFFQEAFTTKNDIFDDDAMHSLPARSGYPYAAWGSLSRVGNGFDDYYDLIDGEKRHLKSLFSSGLLILSKHPIVLQAVIDYGDICTIDDCYANKGVLLTRIRHAQLGIDIDLANTHQQAGSAFDSIRSIQSEIMTSFVQQGRAAPVLIVGGDFNSRLQSGSESLTKIQTRLNVKHAGKECVQTPGCEVATGTSPGRLAGDNLDHFFFGTTGGVKAGVRRGDIPLWTSLGYPLSDHDPLIIDFRFERPL